LGGAAGGAGDPTPLVDVYERANLVRSEFFEAFEGARARAHAAEGEAQQAREEVRVI